MQAPGEKTNIICQGLIVNILHLITATSIIYTSIYILEIQVQPKLLQGLGNSQMNVLYAIVNQRAAIVPFALLIHVM